MLVLTACASKGLFEFEWILIWLFLQLESNEEWINSLCWTFNLKNTLKKHWISDWVIEVGNLVNHRFKSYSGIILQAEESYEMFQLFCCGNYLGRTLCRCSGSGTWVQTAPVPTAGRCQRRNVCTIGVNIPHCSTCMARGGLGWAVTVLTREVV